MKKILKLIIILLSIYLIIELKHLNILPNKYIVPLTISIVILNTLIIKKLKIINTISYIILIPLILIGLKYTLETKQFLKTGFNNNIEINTYNVLVLKENNKTIEEINETGYLKNELEKDYIENINIKEKKEYKNIYELYEDLINKKIESITLKGSYINLLEEEYKDILDKTKIIYSFNIKSETQKQQEIKKLEPINIYISGSDSRSGIIEENTRTDVNMIMTINPNTKTILLTSIPRDYYVKLHNTTGLKDKLTHSGIYGIDMSKKTLEDLFNIKIDYVIKVGFKSVIDIVDLIGGIDIYSDQELTTLCKDGGAEQTYIKKGLNHLTGPQALSYARERYAYYEGDNHRIQNQQQVLEAIITKTIKDKNIILKYNEYLENFKKLYRTDIPESLIKLYIKEQLNKNTTWKVEKQVVKGYGDTNETYSMPGRNLYVMNPDMESVKQATDNINKIINKN